MKRFTFSVMLTLATLVGNAQKTEPAHTWTKNFTTTEQAIDLQRGAPMTIDNEGNAIVTGTYTKDMEFSASYLEALATSAFVVKYDKGGNVLWTAGLKGAATITAVANDAEGNVYAAGVFADIVEILDGKGDQQEIINGMDDQINQVSGFIVKYSKDGKYIASKVIIPEQARNDEGYGDPNPNFIPSKIAASDGKVYLAVSFQGDSKISDNLKLVGQYGSLFGIYTWDIPTLAIVSLSDDFAQAELVAQLAATDMETELGYGAESVNFTTDGSKVYAAFVAYGYDLTLKSANASKHITDLLINDESGDTKYEHAYIIATIENGNITNTQVYHSKIDDNLRDAKFNTVDEMAFANGNIYLAGTFNETFPFDNSKAYVGGCDAYLACLKATDLSKNWALTSYYNEGDVNKKAEIVSGMAVSNDKVQIMGWAEATATHTVEAPLNFTVNTNGTPSKMNVKAGSDAIFTTSVAFNAEGSIFQSDNRVMSDEDKAREGTYTYSFYSNSATGINHVATSDNTISWNGNSVVIAKSADIAIYTTSGMLVKKASNTTSMSLDNVASGIYMVKVGKQTIKIVK